MPDTRTVILKMILPQLGKKPWHKDWYFNFNLLDQFVGGGLVKDPNDNTIHAVIADTIKGSALVPLIHSVQGDLSGISPIPAGETHEIRVDHSSGPGLTPGPITFDFPLEPIFAVPANVNSICLADRLALTNDEYGKIFVIRIENHSTNTINGSDISWLRKGFVLS